MVGGGSGSGRPSRRAATIQPSADLGLQRLLPTQVVNNAIDLVGDLTANGNGSNDLILSGNITLASGQSGVNRVFNVTNTTSRTYLTGIISDRYSFAPVLLVASAVPLVATAFLLTLIRSAPNSRPSPAHQKD